MLLKLLEGKRVGEGKQEALGICSAARILGRCPDVEGMVTPPLILLTESYVSEIL